MRVGPRHTPPGTCCTTGRAPATRRAGAVGSLAGRTPVHLRQGGGSRRGAVTECAEGGSAAGALNPGAARGLLLGHGRRARAGGDRFAGGPGRAAPHPAPPPCQPRPRSPPLRAPHSRSGERRGHPGPGLRRVPPRPRCHRLRFARPRARGRRRSGGAALSLGPRRCPRRGAEAGASTRPGPARHVLQVLLPGVCFP